MKELEQDQILDDFDSHESNLREQDLIKTIWTQPTETFKHLFSKCPDKHVLSLFVAGGAVSGLWQLEGIAVSESTAGTIGYQTGRALMTAVVTWISYPVMAWANSVTGKWIGGSAGFDKMKTVVAWSTFPSLLFGLVAIPRMFYSTPLTFDSIYPNPAVNEHTIAFYGFTAIGIIVNLWCAYLTVIGIKVAQGFSTMKAIFNWLIPILVFMGVVIILALGFYVLGDLLV